MTLSPSLTLSNTLLVPSLSHKLLSISQVTIDLNCIMLIYPTFCLLQDILTKEIIGRGTNRGDYTAWMISVLVERITCIIRVVPRKDIFGFYIVGWGIRHLVICNICFLIYFHIYQLLTLSVILESLLKVIELLIH